MTEGERKYCRLGYYMPNISKDAIKLAASCWSKSQCAEVASFGVWGQPEFRVRVTTHLTLIQLLARLSHCILVIVIHVSL